MKTLILILALAFSAAAQTKAPKWFDIDYDKFKDQTMISFVHSGSPITRAGFLFDGKALATDQNDFYLYFDPQINCRGFCFNDPQLIVLLDGERLDLGVDKVLKDTAYFPVSRAIIERIAAAKVAEFQVGRFEDKWDDKAKAKFKTLLEFATVKK